MKGGLDPVGLTAADILSFYTFLPHAILKFVLVLFTKTEGDHQTPTKWCAIVLPCFDIHRKFRCLCGQSFQD